MPKPEEVEKINGGSAVESILWEKGATTPQFAVGLNIYFELLQKNRRIRARANLLGWYRPSLLITTAPLIDNRLVVVPTGTEVVVRYLLEGSVYGFISRLIQKYQDPIQLWLLSYPEMVEIKNLRQNPRVQTFLQVRSADDSIWLMLDLSTRGALLAVENEYTIGQMLDLSFTLPDGSQIDNLQAMVVRTYNTRTEKSVAVLFNESNDPQLEKIQAYIDSCKFSHHRGITEFTIQSSE